MCWDFNASGTWTQRVSALDKHQNWGAIVFFGLNSQVSKYAVINLIHITNKNNILVFYVINKTFY